MSLTQLPRAVFDGFGFAQRSVSMFARPRSADELAALFCQANQEGMTVAMRGAGRSYGDAALNGGQLILDMRGLDQVLKFDPDTGLVDVQPGVSIRQLYEHSLPHGWWPPVVPGTAFPTLGGCASMNIHGKNHFCMGGIGDHIQEIDLVTPSGQQLTLSRTQGSELFHAVIGGFGMLGAITRVRLQLKRVYSGQLRVRQWAAPNLAAQFEAFAEHNGDSAYLVSWVDCITGGRGLGRGQLHQAWYVKEGEDPQVNLDPTAQLLPATVMGVPKSLVPKVLRLFSFNAGMWLVNTAKYSASVLASTKPYLQGHAAFHFLLDHVPNFRSSYEPGGFLQYQPFVPAEHAQEVFAEILRRTQKAGLMSYLGVMKQYRPDDFLLSHALDGFSMAMDFPVTPANRDALWKLLHQLNDLVLEAGGRFYPAKDSVLRPQDFRRAWGQERIAAFRALRAQVDPDRVLQTEWAARVGVDEPA